MKQDFLNTVNPEFLNMQWNEKRPASRVGKGEFHP
jgi:hypothetical protein